MPGGQSNSQWLVWIVLGLAAVGGSAVLYWFDPTQFGFYPVCVFHRTTGLLCPGCGGLRALHQLLHGHVAAAFRLNALLVIALPLAGAAGLRVLIGRLRHRPGRIEVRPLWIWIGAAAVVAFGIGRNVL